MADKQLEATSAAAAFQKQWFADLRRRVFEERQPYALLQADVPFELFELMDVPAVSNQWWAALIAAKRRAAPFLDAMDADGLHGDLCRYCSLGYASTRYAEAGEAPWGGLPTPRLLCARLTCDCIHRVFELWADAYGAELFAIDNPGAAELPPRWWELGRHRWRELVEPHRLAFLVSMLESLVARCLQKDPERRFARTDEVAAELAALAGRSRPGTAVSADAKGSKATTAFTRGSRPAVSKATDAPYETPNNPTLETSQPRRPRSSMTAETSAASTAPKPTCLPVDSPCPRRSTSTTRYPASASARPHGVRKRLSCR